MGKIKNENKLIFFISFLIGTLITFPSLIPSYSMDGYCSLCSSYSNYALIFVQAGRYLTAFIYYVIDKLNISTDFISTLSIILSNIFLSLSVCITYNQVKKYIKTETLEKILIFIISFIICFNPFMIESFIFEESFALTLAFLLVIVAANYLLSDKKYKYIKSFGLLCMVCMLYQGMLCIYIPYLFLMFTLKTKEKNILKNIKENYKFYVFGFITYALSLILSFVLLKIVLNIFNLNSQKFGELNIMSNISSIFRLTKNTYHSFFNFIDQKIFYFVFISIVIIVLGLTITKFKKYFSCYIYIILLVIFCTVFAFVPNLAMNSLDNYTAARMVNSIGALLGMLSMMSLLFIPKNKQLKEYFLILLLFVIGLFFLYNCKMYLKNSYYGLKRYNNDYSYSQKIKENIDNYEKEKGIKIEKIYYYKESSVPYYYSGLNSGNNIRFYAVDWGFECGIKVFVNKDIEIAKMTVEKYENINDEDLIMNNGIKYIYEGNILYLILVV